MADERVPAKLSEDARRFRNALIHIGAQPDDLKTDLRWYNEATKDGGAREGHFYRRTLLELAENCDKLGIPYWGFQKMEILIMDPGGGKDFAMPILQADSSRRKSALNNLRTALQNGLNIWNSHQDINFRLKLDQMEIRGDEILVSVKSENTKQRATR